MRPAPLVFCLMLALFAFQATGTLAFVSATCEQGCIDDDEQGRCADTCADCSCCFHPRPIAPVAASHPAPSGTLLRWTPAAPSTCRSCPPGEILHVPILIPA